MDASFVSDHTQQEESERFNMEVEKSIGSTPVKDISLIRLIFSCMIAGGVQYGWALQLSLLTPYVQLSWFPFILYDTDWMGHEIFHGSPSGTKDQVDAFDRGVRAGAFGLLLNSIVLLVGGFLIEPLCRKVTARIVWVTGNFMVFLGMTVIAIVSMWSVKSYKSGIQGYITANGDVKIVALVIFAFLGFPMSAKMCVPIKLDHFFQDNWFLLGEEINHQDQR